MLFHFIIICLYPLQGNPCRSCIQAKEKESKLKKSEEEICSMRNGKGNGINNKAAAPIADGSAYNVLSSFHSDLFTKA